MRRHDFSSINHTVSCLSSKTLSENQLCIGWFLHFSLKNISLHFEHLHSLIQSQLKPVGKHTFDPNPVKVQHFADFSCLASYFTVHTRGHFTTATSDDWGSKYIIWRHIRIPCSLLIEQMYTFSTSRLLSESQYYTIQWTGSLFNTLKYEELFSKERPVLKSENTFPIYKVKVSHVSRNNNIPCILFTYLNLCSSAKFYLKSQGKKKSVIICIHSENLMIWEDILHGQKTLPLLTHKEIKICLMVVPELKGKGKRIRANLGYWENVS